MMKKVFKGLEINEKDNAMTSIAKGGTEGALDGLIVTLAIAGVFYMIGKAQQKEVEIQTETAE